jgi:glycine betaine/proline transport system substrate-binding protein
MRRATKIIRVASLGLLALGLSGTAQAAELGAKDEAIKLAINEWTGQHISATIAGELLKKVGYNVEYVTAGAVPQFAAIAQGNLHAQPETWTNNVGDIYPKAVASGDIVVLGSLGLEPREGWIYPPYMEEKCPGLPDYKALYDCAQAFASSETFPDGRLITYPADWGTRSKDVVEKIGVPFKPIAGGSEGAMIAELTSAYAAKEPIIMMFWQPHWLFAQLDFNWVKWNAPAGDCDEAGQTKDSACGFQQASIDKIVWNGFKDKWPAGYQFMDAMTLNNDIQNKLILEVDEKGRPLQEVVHEWIDENQATWQPWIDTATM